MKIEIVVADFDGTIADTKELVFECGEQVLKNHGYPVPSAEKKEKLRALGLIEVLLNHLGIEKYKIPGFLLEGYRLYTKRHKAGEIKPYPEMLEAIENLRKNYRVLILSSNQPQIIEDSFKDWCVECPQIYHLPLHLKHLGLERIIRERKLKNEKNSIVYIGDEIRDYLACKWVGVEMIPVTWGLNNERAFLNVGLKSEELCRHPFELLDKILQIEKKYK